jgi:dTDP-4-dehydrorhamnose reductase
VIQFQKNRIQPSGKKSDLAKKILITGASGMLGATLVDEWQDKYDVYATDKETFEDNPAINFLSFDLLNESYDQMMDWAKPDVIIHCAAITDVDYCEKNPKHAYAVNAESVDKLLQSAPDAKLLFISSDAVFPDGLNLASEKDQTSPGNIYGMTKESGEIRIKDAGPPHVSIRTTIVGKNINMGKTGFVEWLVNPIKDGIEVHLFRDEFFTPITTWHLGDELEWIIENEGSDVIHIAGSETITKYDFGRRICSGLGLNPAMIKKNSINDFNFQAKRSKDKTLDSQYHQSLSGHNLPDIQKTVDMLVNHFKESPNE